MKPPSGYHLFMSPLNVHGLMDSIAAMEDEGVIYVSHWLMTPQDLNELRLSGEKPDSLGYWVLGRQQAKEDEKSSLILDS